MIAHLSGLVAEKDENTLVIECGGVGYLLTVSAATLAQTPAVGETMKCHTHMNVREDGVDLFGFATREEKRMFLRLTQVSGIGPRTAIDILSAISVRDLSVAIVTGDAAALARAPRIGKKTAQRLILELKDKIGSDEIVPAGVTAAKTVSAPANAADEAIEALMALGYQASEAARAVASVSPMPDQASEIVRLALKGMMK